jgi:hypothetical protein
MTVVADELVPIICRLLASKILKQHRACMTWDDEVSSVHECSHLEDANIVMDFVKEWRENPIIPIHDHGRRPLGGV